MKLAFFLIAAILVVSCVYAESKNITLNIPSMTPREFATVYVFGGFAIKSITLKTDVAYVNNVVINIEESDVLNVEFAYTNFNFTISPGVNLTVPVGFNATPPIGKVYKYMTVRIRSSYMNVGDAVFEVPAAWLAQNGFGHENVSLKRFSYVWQDTPLTLVNFTGSSYVFRASILDVPNYAIIAQTSADLAAEAAERVTINDIEIDPLGPLISITSLYPKETQYVIISVTLLVTLILFYLYYRRYREKKTVEKYTDPNKARKRFR